MNEYNKKIIRAWSFLRQEKSLPKELDVTPEEILSSDFLKARVLEEYDKKLELDKMWFRISENEKDLGKVVKSAIGKVADYFKQKYNCLLWVGSFGAIGINPKNLYVFYVLPTDVEVEAFRKKNLTVELESMTLEQLSLHGYPVKELENEWMGLYSEEECQRRANGNWYYFFK